MNYFIRHTYSLDYVRCTRAYANAKLRANRHRVPFVRIPSLLRAGVVSYLAPEFTIIREP